MKIAISAAGPGLDAEVDPRFGRCQYFVVADPETMEFEAVDNSSAMAAGGAGVSGTVKDAIEGYRLGKLKASAQANVPDHFGMGGISGMGGGFGMGRGMGRGVGMGRGMGRGMGMGFGTADTKPGGGTPGSQGSIPGDGAAVKRDSTPD